MILIIIIVFLTVMEAIHEGLALRGKNEGSSRLGTIAGIVEMIKLAGMVVIVMFLLYTKRYDSYYDQMWKFWAYFLPSLLVGWGGIRYALFDFFHNWFAHLDIWYIGKMKLFDKMMGKLLKRQVKPRFFVITRLWFIVLGVAVLLHL
jgi:hypothetical protein